MQWIRSTRLGVLLGIPILVTTALAGPVSAAGPVSPSPAAKAATPRDAAGSGHVRQVQRALATAGYDPGPIDGIMGPRTKSALQKYIAVPPPQVPRPADRILAPLRANERREGQ